MSGSVTRRRIGSRRSHKVNAMSFAILCRLMMEGTHTCYELAEESGLNVMTIYDWTATLHKYGVIHVCMWDGEGRSAKRVFKLGAGLDAPRPVKGRARSTAEYRAKRRAATLLHRMAGTCETKRVRPVAQTKEKT